MCPSGWLGDEIPWKWCWNSKHGGVATVLRISIGNITLSCAVFIDRRHSNSSIWVDNFITANTVLHSQQGCSEHELLALENNTHHEMLKGSSITKIICPQGAHSLAVEKGQYTGCLSFALTGVCDDLKATSYLLFFCPAQLFQMKDKDREAGFCCDGGDVLF